MKVMKRKAVVLAIFASLLAAGAAQAGITKVGKVYSGSKPADKPYQLVHVGSEVSNGMGNSVYVAFFATRTDDPANDVILDANGNPELDGTGNPLPGPNTEEAFTYDITGYPAFLKIPDSANDASLTQVWAFPACAPYLLPNKTKRQEFIAAVEDLETNGPLEAEWTAGNWTPFLQALHGMDYSINRGELVGGLTFLGKILRWDLNAPGTLANPSGVCNSNSLSVGEITRSRLIKYSSDRSQVIAALRGQEENPSEAILELRKFAPAAINGTSLSTTPITDATSGHAIYVTPNAVYTAGTDFRRLTPGNSPSAVQDFVFAPGSAPSQPAAFLNIAVQENSSGDPVRIYALNSRDWDPADLMTVPATPTPSTLVDYQNAFKTAATAFGAGLYVYDVSNYDPINEEYVLTRVTTIAAAQPVELVLDGSRLFFNDRIGQQLVEVDVSLATPAKVSTLATDCLSSNLIKGAGNTLYLSSVWSEQLYSVGGTLSGAACNAVEKYTYSVN
ncbi:hypothetical protein CBF45_08410 [Bordetella sp. J329]|nr:hypothetical protein CBF45_08410 [Bordetella sp. J329]